MAGTQQTIPRFIIIDDDPINNLICRKNINNIFSLAEIQTFTDPQAGLNYISSEYDPLGTHKTILFLDINMPVLSGWDVLNILVRLSDNILEHFRIYMLSSSIATPDKQRADDCHIVEGFLTKPLTRQELEKVCAA